ncbi:MAG: hypothetical protein N0E48_09980, partial [Candidatus Thiodiazotropha endolucinida]|nr:hypothetical protein [Candidatus Thiodiazotropha taylori]MCW4343677.1 hypothetical protein [Candidatus Thiodiazotropha endolucinida]
MRLLILLSLIGYAVGVIIHENVAFQHVNDVTSTRAKWLVSFVHDLEPFRYFLRRVYSDILKATEVTNTLSDHFTDPQQQGFRATLKQLGKEVKSLQETQHSLITSYVDYRALGTRSERSILPLGGRILSFLFGTVSEADLDDIKRAVRDMSQNQQSIMHMLDEQMTILNVSRIQIAENRQAIMSLVDCMDEFEGRIHNLTVAIQKRFEHIEMFVNIYAQMDLILAGLRDAIQRGTIYLDNLRLEINMLSLSRLSPSSITPRNLRKLLTQINNKLPSTLKLPEDPRSNIWYFYRTLTCSTIMDGSQIVVVINIPLLDFTGEYEVYRVYNIPLPMPSRQNKVRLTYVPDMVAKYDIESAGLLINKDRSRYTLLTEHELLECSNQFTKYCSPRSAIMPVNLNQLCVLALFFKDEPKVNKYCCRLVQPNTLLPMGTYLTQGLWVIGTKEKIDFSIVCLGMSGRKSIKTHTTQAIDPPLGIIQLEPGCHAANNFLSLPPYYFFEEQVDIPDPYKELLELHNTTKFKLWEPFSQALPNFSKLELP